MNFFLPHRGGPGATRSLTSKRGRTDRRPCVESLEVRQLLAYTFSLEGTVATATGDDQSDVLTIGASGGLLFHSVNGSAPDFNWGSSGASTLAAGQGSLVRINQGTGDDGVVLISSSAAGASLAGTEIDLFGGGPADTLRVDDSANTASGNEYSINTTSVNGPAIEANFFQTLGGGVTLLGGSGSSNISIDSTAAGQPVNVVANGLSNMTVGGGTAAVQIRGGVSVSGPTGAVTLAVDDSIDDGPGRAGTLVGNSNGTSVLSGIAAATITATTANLKSYTILTGPSGDSLNVDLSAANPIPQGGLTYSGGSGNDTLDANAGGRAVDVSTAGVISFAGSGPLNYRGVEAVNIINAANPPLTPVPQTINTTVGVPLNQVNAGSFTGALPTAQPSTYSAAIDWGDGTTTAGTIDLNPGATSNVLGSHTYTAPGTYAVRVPVTDHGSTVFSTVAGVPISVSNPGGIATVINSTAVVQPLPPSRLVVTTTADLINGVPAPGSLRANLLAANVHPGPDTIIFDIVPNAAVETIKLDALLPEITDPVTLDATTQPGYQGKPIVVVDGSTTPGDGLVFTAGNSTVRGLVIGGFSGAGVRFEAGGGDLIQNSYIGTDASGQRALPNGIGVLVENGAGTTIGGTAAGAGNTISGNLTAGVYLTGGGVTGTRIIGNRIGTDPTGTAPVVHGSATDPLQALQNTGVVIVDSGGNTVGGTNPGEGNLLSGNYVGVMVAGAGGSNVIQGNLIGTDASGATALSNIVGVYLNGSAGNVVGGTAPGAGNTVSGNSSVGVEILGSAATGNRVEGNLIGLAADGKGTLRGANGAFIQSSGVFIQAASGNVIGGAAGNVISGNQSAGVFVLSRGGVASGNVVQANFIGLGPGGSPGPGNTGYGVLLFNAPNNQVARTGASANQFGRNGLGNIQVFNGPLPESSESSLIAPSLGKRGRVRRPLARRHPNGPLGHRRGVRMPT